MYVDVNLHMWLYNKCSKLRPPLQFRPAFLEPTPWQVFSINTLIFQHSLSFSHFHLQGQHTLSSVTSRENTITVSFQLTAVYRHKNVYAMQAFSYMLHLFGEIFPTSKTTEISSNHRKKERNNMGEDTFLLIYTIKIL